MKASPSTSASPPGPTDRTGVAPLPMPYGIFGHVRQVLRRMGASPDRRALFWLVVGLVVVIVSNMGGQLWLNEWQGRFYDALERRDWPSFVAESLNFLKIAGTLLVLVVAQTWFTEMIKIRLRSWLTENLLDDWLVNKRAYLLTFAGEAGANPDQRIHEDTRHFAELTADLGASLLQATLLLVSFVGVLWMLSEQVKFEIGGKLVGIPGYMVWCAIGFALAGSTLTWWVGQPMVEDNAARYAREAEMRFALVRIGESAEGITLYGGEADERRTLAVLFDNVVRAMRRLADDLARLTWVTSGYGWLALVVPVIVASPGYFVGAMSLGGLMMVVNAFNQVQSSLRWFVDNFSRLADWRATFRRIEALHEALAALDRPNGVHGHIDFVVDPDDGLVFEDFELALPSGRASFEKPSLSIAAGERVQIFGEPSAGKSTLFLTIAGLWSRGNGRIRLPPRDRIAFLPERPYFPLGSLREALAYPEQGDGFDTRTMQNVLDAVGLRRLVNCLDDVERWDKRLAGDEQQMLAFARVLLHKPAWVVMDDATSDLDLTQTRRVFEALEPLTGTTVVSLTRSEDLGDFFHRSVRLGRRPRITGWRKRDVGA
ncbi:MAG: ABC transporter ATP-binding protein/permease [Siculibacillus sp.]|nr:ABC transporter ATP-binding protein/permease [Siculibacillus sp.]